MDKLLQYSKVFTNNDGEFRQYDTTSIKLNDGNEVYGHKIYMNKILRESGFKNIRTVNDIVNIVGDSKKKLNKVEFSGVIAVDENTSSYIYLNSMNSYNNLIGIAKIINSYKHLVLGDTTDFTSFQVILSNKKLDYVVDINLKSEWICLYSARSDDEWDTEILMNTSLNSENDVAKAFKDMIKNKCHNTDQSMADMIFDPAAELVSDDLARILSSAKLIKWSSRNNRWKLMHEINDPDISIALIKYLEILNTYVNKRRSYYTKFVVTARTVLDTMNLVFQRIIDSNGDSDKLIQMNVSNFLWTVTRWQIDTDE